ncbi:hypothetical protein D0Z00_000911 [Geotrichum galactomycetum]|uniref:Uncharacterized protein n=1 Tax=Geotrichum galactomycetum TaxID=27317 RepID=A0ACB6V8J5_9ASCO|nr:hypothetical protein D0Z00_000911 [Geotrichum candidum]
MPSATVATTETYSAMPSNRLKRDNTDVLVDASTSTADESDSVKRPRLADSDPFGHNMFKAYVKTTLDEAEKQVNSLISKLSLTAGHESLSSEHKASIIKALTSEIGRLDKQIYASLISTLLDIKWSRESREFMNIYASFITVLVSAIPRWSTMVTNKLVLDFTRENTDIHHSVLKYILALLPTASSSLPSTFQKHFPHKSDNTKYIIRYISNLLRVVSYAPQVRNSVWALIMEKTVELDVELQEDLEDDDDEEEIEDDMDKSDEEDEEENIKQTSLKELLGANDNDTDNEEDDDGMMSDTSEYNVESMDMTTAVVRHKLDAVMSLLLNHLDGSLSHDQIESGDGQLLFVTLQNLFKTYVLSTYRTTSVQYLLFWASHANPVLMDAFLASLIETALSPNENMEKRLKAMQYISSFIARAKGLSQTQIIFTISILASWLSAYIEEREAEVDSVAGGGMGKFKMFYSVTQTMMYIFCFRHALLRKEHIKKTQATAGGADELDGLKIESSDSQWVCDLDKLFRRLIITKFNPLRYCRRTVVSMFAQIAQKEDLVYCFTVMEQNRLGQTTLSATPTPAPTAANTPNVGGVDVLWKKNQDFVMMDAYFPFDPLSLPNCKERIQSMYVEWNDVANDSDSGSEDYDDDDEDDDE